MRIVHHSKTIGYAGTDRSAQLFVKYLNKLPDVEAFLVYRENDDTSRLEECKQTIGKQYLIPYQHEYQPNAKPPYLPKSDNLASVLADLKPDIFHIHRGGWPEHPGFKSICPTAKLVETNIFAGVDHSPDIDLHLYISNFIAVRSKMLGGPPGLIVQNPTEPPIWLDRDSARTYLLRELALPANAILLGRVGRPDNFDPIALKALKRIQDRYPHVYYLVMNPCQQWRKTAKRIRVKNVIFLPPVISDTALSRFHAGIDIYAHARVDGECQSCSLNAAFVAGLPVTTHEADTYQGQVDQVNESGAGLVASHHDDVQYANHLMRLIDDPIERASMGKAGIKWAKENVDAELVTQQLYDIYQKVLQ